MSNRIPRGAVRDRSDAVMVAAGGGGVDDRPIAVIPLREGEVIAGFEVRCSCGSRAVVDCIYDAAEPAGSMSPQSAAIAASAAEDQEGTP